MQRSISTSAHPLENKPLDIYVYVYYKFFNEIPTDKKKLLIRKQ